MHSNSGIGHHLYSATFSTPQFVAVRLDDNKELLFTPFPGSERRWRYVNLARMCVCVGGGRVEERILLYGWLFVFREVSEHYNPHNHYRHILKSHEVFLPLTSQSFALARATKARKHLNTSTHDLLSFRFVLYRCRTQYNTSKEKATRF